MAKRRTVPRHGQIGWGLLAMHDKVGRRGLWWRRQVEAGEVSAIELCSGREGDDAEVRIERASLPDRTFYELSVVLELAEQPLVEDLE